MPHRCIRVAGPDVPANRRHLLCDRFLLRRGRGAADAGKWGVRYQKMREGLGVEQRLQGGIQKARVADIGETVAPASGGERHQTRFVCDGRLTIVYHEHIWKSGSALHKPMCVKKQEEIAGERYAAVYSAVDKVDARRKRN